jgi:phosphatidylserine decarboxylase
VNNLMVKSALAPIHRDGWPFVAGFAIVALALGQWVSGTLGWLGLLATAWCVYFFRDPERVPPERGGLVLAPADGLVEMVQPALPPPELGMAAIARPRVSIFLSIFDVHVNRVPADGTITELAYRPGKFLNAALDKASEENERQSIRLTVEGGRELAFVQIAGLIARRIRCDLAKGQTVRAGERFGLIRFGSRVDVYLPEGVVPLVRAGQRMVAGETVLADLATPSRSRGD